MTNKKSNSGSENSRSETPRSRRKFLKQSALASFATGGFITATSASASASTVGDTYVSYDDTVFREVYSSFDFRAEIGSSIEIVNHESWYNGSETVNQWTCHLGGRGTVVGDDSGDFPYDDATLQRWRDEITPPMCVSSDYDGLQIEQGIYIENPNSTDRVEVKIREGGQAGYMYPPRCNTVTVSEALGGILAEIIPGADYALSVAEVLNKWSSPYNDDDTTWLHQYNRGIFEGHFAAAIDILTYGTGSGQIDLNTLFGRTETGFSAWVDGGSQYISLMPLDSPYE